MDALRLQCSETMMVTSMSHYLQNAAQKTNAVFSQGLCSADMGLLHTAKSLTDATARKTGILKFIHLALFLFMLARLMVHNKI